MKKDRKKMWRRVLEFIIAVLLGMILHGLVRNLVAEADAKAYEFIVPDVDIEYLSSADIQDMPLQVVCYAKNEIYARHGRMFQSQELTNYFEEQLWYYGCISPSEFSSSVLNVYETANIKLLSDRESALRSGGYVLDQPGYDFSAVYQYIYGNISYEVQNDYYVFPDSDARYLSNADIQGMSAQELCYGKNEIYARHGRTFRSGELTDYFATKSWYYGSVAPADFNSAVFNTYENNNIKFLTDAENALTNGNGYVLDQPGYNIYAVGISDYYYDDDRLENDFIFYDSDTRYLTDAEVKGLSLQVVCYAKNEIYARRGRIFDSQELNDYFYSKPWYYGRILPEDFSSDVFNKYELANITLLDGYERALAPNGYQLY